MELPKKFRETKGCRGVMIPDTFGASTGSDEEKPPWNFPRSSGERIEIEGRPPLERLRPARPVKTTNPRTTSEEVATTDTGRCKPDRGNVRHGEVHDDDNANGMQRNQLANQLGIRRGGPVHRRARWIPLLTRGGEIN